MEEKKNLWELVRKKLGKENEIENKNLNNEKNININIDKKKENNVEYNEEKKIELVNEGTKEIEKNNILFLNQGIFAGFIYILTIMIILGILMIPGSITAAIGGYFGGRKSGDPARALTAAMLPFLIIASISIMGSVGALPPGSGPNELSDNMVEFLGYNNDENLLGPISKMPDSNSSVFISLVTFGFIGGLVEAKRKKNYY